jgi:hypothetical protein
MALCPSTGVNRGRQYAGEDALFAGHGFNVYEAAFEYCLRSPLSNERLSLLPDGRLRYELKRRWSDGTTHVIYEPLELMERLAALVPPPRFNVTRYYGVLAPASTFRPLIVPKDKTSLAPTHSGCRPRVESPKTDSTKTKSPVHSRTTSIQPKVPGFSIAC